MNHISETDDSLGGVILRVVDSMVTVGIMAVVVGIVLFTLFPSGSFGATSALDPGGPASVMTTSKQVQGPELPAREASRSESFTLNLEKKDAARLRFHLGESAGNSGHGSENVIRSDETSVRFLAPWQ